MSSTLEPALIPWPLLLLLALIGSPLVCCSEVAAHPSYCPNPKTIGYHGFQVKSWAADPRPVLLYPSPITATCRWNFEGSDDSANNIALEVVGETGAAAEKFAQLHQFTLSGTFVNGSTSIGWHNRSHFLLVPLILPSDKLTIDLAMDTAAVGSIRASRDSLHLRAFHSRRGACSKGLLHFNGSCYAERTTDKTAQAAAFDSEEQLQRLVSEFRNGGQWSVAALSSPIRLAMAHCDKLNSLIYWARRSGGGGSSSGRRSCVCEQLPLEASRLLEGSVGDCVALLDTSAAEAMFQRVSCTGAMATLLSFPATPRQMNCAAIMKAAAAAADCPLELLQARCCHQFAAANSSRPAAFKWQLTGLFAAVLFGFPLLCGILRLCAHWTAGWFVC